MYLSITLCTGELLENSLCLFLVYFPAMEERLLRFSCLRPYLLGPAGYQGTATQETDPTRTTAPAAPHSPMLRVPFSPDGHCSPQVSPTGEHMEGSGGEPSLDSAASAQKSRERRASRLHTVDVPFIPILSTTAFLSAPSPGPGSDSRRQSRADLSSAQAHFSTGFEPEFLSPDSNSSSRRQSTANMHETRNRDDSGSRYSDL